MKKQKFLTGSRNIRFSEAVALAEAFGFQLNRINGQVKPYPTKPLPQLIEAHNLQLEGN